MKLNISFFLILIVLCFVNDKAFSVVAVNNSVDQKEIETLEIYNQLSPKAKKKFERQTRKIKKRIKRKAQKNKRAAIDSSILDDARFRLGAVVFAAGLAFLLLSILFIGFGPFIVWVGRLATLIGLILMVWALIENID